MEFSAVTKGMRKVLPLKYCGAVIVAAGTASRMGGIDKVMAELDGEPMILHTVRTFQNSDAIKEIVVVTREDLILPIMRLCAGLDKVKAVACGGKSRQESVQLGLNALSSKVKLVAVQDGARPLITDAVIDRTVRAAHSYGAAAPAVPVKDTIKTVKGGVVKDTPDRATLQRHRRHSERVGLGGEPADGFFDKTRERFYEVPAVQMLFNLLGEADSRRARRVRGLLRLEIS